MTSIPRYHNDGSGRDSYINHAGASWMNPLPGGTYHKSQRAHGATTRDAMLAESIDPFASMRPPGGELFGKSRYGTTVIQGGANADGTYDRVIGGTHGFAGPTADRPPGNDLGEPFDPEATALDVIPYDVANPERRLLTPGHATTGPEVPGGDATFTGTGDPWAAPKQVDNTLLRLRPTYESTCHYGLRTGKVYVPADAPPPEVTMLDMTKTRYY